MTARNNDATWFGEVDCDVTIDNGCTVNNSVFSEVDCDVTIDNIGTVANMGVYLTTVGDDSSSAAFRIGQCRIEKDCWMIWRFKAFTRVLWRTSIKTGECVFRWYLVLSFVAFYWDWCSGLHLRLYHCHSVSLWHVLRTSATQPYYHLLLWISITLWHINGSSSLSCCFLYFRIAAYGLLRFLRACILNLSPGAQLSYHMTYKRYWLWRHNR